MIRRPPRSTPYTTLFRSHVFGRIARRAAQLLAYGFIPAEHFQLLCESLRQISPKSPEVSSERDRKSTRLNSSHANISYAVFCLKKKQQHLCSRLRIVHIH